MTKKIANYEAPRLTVVEFRTEKGFAVSSFGALETVQMLNNQFEAITMDVNGNLVAGYMDGEAIDNSGDPVGSGWEFQNGGYF